MMNYAIVTEHVEYDVAVALHNTSTSSIACSSRLHNAVVDNNSSPLSNNNVSILRILRPKYMTQSLFTAP